MEKLKSCPFCGKPAKLYVCEGGVCVMCTNVGAHPCRCRTDWYDDSHYNGLTKSWRRVSESIEVARMDDLISRQAAIEALAEWGDAEIENRIKNIPSSVRHGAWIWEKHIEEYICSECGRITYDRHDELIEWEGAKGFALKLPYWCGYCGAKMDRKEK